MSVLTQSVYQLIKSSSHTNTNHMSNQQVKLQIIKQLMFKLNLESIILYTM